MKTSQNNQLSITTICFKIVFSLFVIGVFCSTTFDIHAQSSIKKERMSLSTYPFSDPNPIPILAENPKIYPYFKFEGYSHESKPREWNVVVLENDYIKVFVLPESGGKVWGAIEKSTGEEFIYRNEVMKFRNIAMRGPWTSGGIEFNFGIIGHTPATATPVNYLTQTNDDGSVTCLVGNLDVPSRTYWRVAITLPKDKAYFETKVTWYNPTPVHQSYYNWMTGAAATGDDLEFFIPGDQYLTHPGEPKSWPMDGDREIFRYKENNYGPSKSYHIVGEYNDFFGGYFHNKKIGFGHWSNYEEMPGQKLWLWALSRSGGIWEDLLTDTDGQYIEFQAGRQLNQYSPGNHQNPITKVPFQPNMTDIWSELWFPVKGIGGLTEVSPDGILHVQLNNEEMTVGINALAKSKGTLRIALDNKTVLEETISLNPMEVLSKTILLENQGLVSVDIDEMDLHFTSDPNANLIKRPFESEPDFNLQLSQALYHQGFELMEDRDYEKAKEVFQKVLETDQHHQLTLLALAEMDYKSGLYEKSLDYVNKVLKQDTYHARANFQAGIVYRALGDQVNALESLGWAARSMEFRSAAYAQMAEVFISKKEYSKSLQYVRKSLDFNRYNINALQAGLIVGRKTNQKDVLANYGSQLSTIDPLNHVNRFEQYLSDRSKDSKEVFLNGFQNELPHQNILEIGVYYANLSLKKEGSLAFALIPDRTVAKMWLAHLQPDNMTKHLESVVSASSEYVFPFRRESIAVLESAVQNNPSWKFKYYLALNYWDKGRFSEAADLMKACGQQPDYFVFYLSRADLNKKLKRGDELSELKKASELAPSEWRIQDRLIGYYQDKSQADQALKVASKAIKKYPKNNSIQLKYVKSLLYSEQSKKALSMLSSVNILPFEGASEGRSLYENAHLMEAADLIESKKYDKAIALLKNAQKWPENIGVGKPYDPDHRAIDFLLAQAYQKKGDKRIADENYQKILDYGEGRPSHISSLFEVLSARELKNNDRMDKAITRIKKKDSDTNQWIMSILNGKLKANSKPNNDDLKIRLFTKYFL